MANDVTLANLARMLDRTQPYVPVPGEFRWCWG